MSSSLIVGFIFRWRHCMLKEYVEISWICYRKRYLHEYAICSYTNLVKYLDNYVLQLQLISSILIYKMIPVNIFSLISCCPLIAFMIKSSLKIYQDNFLYITEVPIKYFSRYSTKLVKTKASGYFSSCNVYYRISSIIESYEQKHTIYIVVFFKQNS